MATNTSTTYTQVANEDTRVFTFDLLGSFSAVVVKVRPLVDTTFTTKVVNVDYTLDRDNSTIQFIAGKIPPVGALIVVFRNTTRERQVDYVSGSTLTERTMDNDTNRLTSVDQEIESDLDKAMIKTDDNLFWEGEELPSIRCRPSQTPDGWVTRSEVEGLLTGQIVTDPSGAKVFTGTGDGIETEFELAGLAGGNRQIVDVYVESVYQSADGSVYELLNLGDDDYPTAGTGDDFIQFLVPPVDGATWELKVLTGNILSTLQQGSITTGLLADKAVTVSKMTMGSGDATRVYIGDLVGDVTARVLTPADIIDTGTLATALATAIKAGISIDQLLDAAADVSLGATHKMIESAPTVGTDDDDVLTTKGYVDTEVSDLGLQFQVLDFEFQIFKETDFTVENGWFNGPAGVGAPDKIIPLGFRPDLFMVFFSVFGWFNQNASGAVYTHTDSTVFTKLWLDRQPNQEVKLGVQTPNATSVRCFTLSLGPMSAEHFIRVKYNTTSHHTHTRMVYAYTYFEILAMKLSA